MSRFEEKNLVEYYKINRFNPVLIPLENESQLLSHFDKRRNLYERHLGIPLVLLDGKSVLEFGPNSGENALVLAKFGANLTLVEPNDQVIPRLRTLFRQFGLTNKINIINSRLEDFDTDDVYDLVIAEGFLFTLNDREKQLLRIGNFVKPGSFGVISFTDRYGSFLEMLRRILLYRACCLVGVLSVHSETSLNLAQQLYSDDFSSLPASRNLETWWKDSLVNPFLSYKYMWSYLEVLTDLAGIEADFYSSSPKWSSFQHYTWYKSVGNAVDSMEKIHTNWRSKIPYFLSGMRPTIIDSGPGDDVIIELEKLIQEMSAITSWEKPSEICTSPPTLLLSYLNTYPNDQVKRFSKELATLFNALTVVSKAKDLVQAYHSLSLLRKLWGVPYHYLCFQKAL